MQLRDYQSQTIEDIRKAFLKGNRRVLLQLPTGGGKTIISAFMIKTAIEKGLKVLFLVHLRELIDQTSNKIKEIGVQHGVICAGYEQNLEANCQLAMIQTLSRRVEKIDFVPDLIITDEAHHSASKTYVNLLARFPRAMGVGLTATPERLDGKGLKDLYDVIVCGPKMRKLMDEGYLNEYRYMSVPKEINLSEIATSMGDYNVHEVSEAIEKAGILGDCVDHYREKLEGKKAIVFCTKITHSIEMMNRFVAAGYKAEHLDGKTIKSEREAIIGRFKSGETKILCNCSLISEGFDVPDCDGIIMLRPTKSLGLYLQMCGRALRKSNEKTIILDHVGNYKQHGMPDDDRVWSLEGRKKRKKDNKLEIQIKTCEKCFSVYNGKQYKVCPHCSYKNESRERSDIQEFDGKLIEIDINGNRIEVEKNKQGGYTKKSLNKLLYHCKSLSEIQELGRTLGYKKGWALKVWETRRNYARS